VHHRPILMSSDLRSASVGLCRRQTEGHVARHTQRPLRVLLFASEKVRISLPSRSVAGNCSVYIGIRPPSCHYNGTETRNSTRRGEVLLLVLGYGTFVPGDETSLPPSFPEDPVLPGHFCWVGLMRGLLGLRVMKFRRELGGCVFSSEGSPTHSPVITLSYCKG